MKRSILFSVGIVAIFSSVLIVSCSIGVGQNDETQIYKCHSPHPTRSMIVVNRPSQTSELMAELQIAGAPTADSFTIRGPLGVYTTTHGVFQVELEPETMNKFDVTAHFPSSVIEMNGSECIWQGSAAREEFVITHSYEDDVTPPTDSATLAATPTIAGTQIPRCYSPHPTGTWISVNHPTGTSELIVELKVMGAAAAESFTITGPLGIYTTTHRTVQVELEPGALNKFEVRANFPASVIEMNGSQCIWQGSASGASFVIFHNDVDDATPPTPTPDS